MLTDENLSELGATSDSFGALRRKAVRTQGYFRQLWCSQTKSCPNLELLQTALVTTDEKLSELEATSDSFGVHRQKAV